MRLLIAEKPSVARDIARVLGVSRKHDGYLEGSGYVISWCVGHLVELIEPHEYNPDWKRWALGSLPMIPETFRLRPVKQTEDQFRVVARLLKRSDVQEVINACDAGREGELIFRYLYSLSGSQQPILRLWISSMTDQAIQEGMAKLRPAREFERLYAAARSRSEADWLVGLNATRAITVRSRQGQPYSKDAPLYSVGRVQTPTLALLVDRELEIRNFVSKDYWQLTATFSNPKGTWIGKWFRPAKNPLEPTTVDRFDTEAEARAIQSLVQDKTGQVIDVEQKRTKEPPPMLFDLTRLQRTANKRYGFSAARTLEVAQALYERHKLLTYPRTDSTHLGNDMVPGLKGTISALKVGPYATFSDRLLALPKLPISKRFVDDAKVSDHHAIIPTPNRPRLESLNEDERKIYDLVVRRFLGIFFPDAIFDKTKVITEVEQQTFVTRGKVMIDAGWREVAGFKDDEPAKKKQKEKEEGDDREEEEEEDQGALPPLKAKDPAHVDDVNLQTKQTQPPPRFNEASLLAAMEGAGKLIEEEELQQAMKDTGLGTPATRASIIETLLSRQYIFRKGKALIPTEKGIALISAIPVESLRSPQLTGEWEARLARMARGDYPADRFMHEVAEYVRDVVDRIKRARPIQLTVAMAAPPEIGAHGDDADTGSSEGGAKGGKRSSSDASGKGSGKTGGKKGSDKGTGKGLEKGADSKGLTAGASGAAPEKSSRKKKEAEKPPLPEGAIGHCPRCQGPVEQKSEAFECTANGRGCGYRMKLEIAGKKLSAAVVGRLLEKGRSNVIKGFVSPKSGVKFDAVLTLRPDGGIGFEFQSEKSSPSEPVSSKKGTVATAHRGTSPAEPEQAPPLPRSPQLPASQMDTVQSERRHEVGSQSTPQNAGPVPQEGQTLSLFGSPARRPAQTEPSRPPAAASLEEVPGTRQTAEPPTAPEHPIEQIQSPAGVQLGQCPLCQKGVVITGKKAWGCSRWKEGCGFLVPFQAFGRSLTEGEARRLIQTGHLGPLKGLELDGQVVNGTLRLKLEREQKRSRLAVDVQGSS